MGSKHGVGVVVTSGLIGNVGTDNATLVIVAAKIPTRFKQLA